MNPQVNPDVTQEQALELLRDLAACYVLNTYHQTKDIPEEEIVLLTHKNACCYYLTALGEMSAEIMQINGDRYLVTPDGVEEIPGTKSTQIDHSQ